MLGMPFCGHLPALAPLPLSRGHECRSATFRPHTPTRIAQSSRCRAAKDADELQLVSREETTDGAILFVFGDEASAAAHQAESPFKVEEPAEPEPERAEPLEQMRSAAQSPPAAQEEVSEPEAAYEKTRGKKVKEAVMEAKVKHGAEESGMVDAAHQDSVLSNGAGLLPDFEGDEDPDELLSDEDAPDLQDEIAKTLTSLKVKDLKEMCKERKIRGYSAMRKSQLVRTLKPILAEEM